MEEREGVARFWFRERKLLLGKILDTKIIDCCVKRFHMIKGVKIRCFILP
jgi:hypothetical protein